MAAFTWAYGYARICGSSSRAFLGPRAAELARTGRVGDLWRELFREDPPPLPAALLAAAAERRLRVEAVKLFVRIAGLSILEQAFFRTLLSKAEFSLVKRLLVSMRGAAPEAGSPPPDATELPFAPSFDLKAFPDPAAMFEGSRFSWIAEQGFDDLALAKNHLDRQYYEELWEALDSIPRRLRGSLASILARDIEVENLLWALRLRRYYALSRDAIAPLLIHPRRRDCQSAPLAALALRPDVRADWAGWKWEPFINDAPSPGQAWYFDVRYFETALRRRRFAELRRAFHLEPATFVPLYCYFRIKEYETASIFAVIEGLQMEAPFAEISDFVEGLTEVGS
jgi:hypothetical protein